jgi:hypothetical protein
MLFINKILKYIGLSLVSLKWVYKYKIYRDNHYNYFDLITDYPETFHMTKSEESYIVYCNFKNNKFIKIKEFPFDNDIEYAELCAKELLEELNK